MNASLPDQLISFCQALSPFLPPAAWWIVALLLLVLGVAAAIDAFKGIVPDLLIFPAVVALLGGMALYIEWPDVAHRLLWGFGAALILWAINELWYHVKKQDGFGMGDVKWSFLAVTGLDWKAVLIAWGAGAVIAVIWLGLRKLAKRPTPHVHFAPFLFLGLIAGGVWLAYA